MTLIDALYSYAWENRAGPGGPAAQHASRDREALEQLLEGRAAELFQRYLDHEAEADVELRLALFRRGLSLGLELVRL